MNDPSDALERALRTIGAVRACLPDLVIIGGWVPRLLREFGGTAGWESEPIHTRELDILVPAPLEGVQEERLDQTLRDSGFDPALGERPEAVWQRGDQIGERLELFIQHRGPAGRSGRVLSVGPRGLIGAISLPGVGLLREHSRRIDLPLPGRSGGPAENRGVAVPDLAVFLLHKAAAFPRRRELEKRAKDVLYLVEVMAAGPAVEAEVEAGLARLGAARVQEGTEIVQARFNLRCLIQDPRSFQGLITLVTRMMVERGGGTEVEARYRAIGRLEDLADMLDRHLGEGSGRR